MSSLLTSRRTLRALFATAVLVAVAACYERAPAGPDQRLISAVPDGAVQVVLQQESVSGNELTLVARIIGNGIDVGAYQGEIKFVPGSLELVGVTTPTADNEMHIVNPAQFAQGRLRFAAYTTASKFTSSEAFTVRVRTAHALADAQIVGSLEVVGEPAGRAIAKNKLLASRGIHDAVTNQLIVP